MPLDPVSLGLGAVQTVGGIVQSLTAGKHKAERNLENQINSYQKNPSIMDYYTKALSRYNANPYTSATYQNSIQNAGRGLTTGLSALGDRRSILSGLPVLTQAYNDNALKSAAEAEREQSGELNQLGNATRMKVAEDRVPFDMKYNLLAQKAAGANAQKAAGLKNIFGGVATALTGGIGGSGSTKKPKPPLDNTLAPITPDGP